MKYFDRKIWRYKPMLYKDIIRASTLHKIGWQNIIFSVYIFLIGNLHHYTPVSGYNDGTSYIHGSSSKTNGFIIIIDLASDTYTLHVPFFRTRWLITFGYELARTRTLTNTAAHQERSVGFSNSVPSFLISELG